VTIVAIAEAIVTVALTTVTVALASVAVCKSFVYKERECKTTSRL
jgi:hypothetical protein